VGQNIYLNSAALNLVCCGVGGFKDDELNKLLDLEGAEESVVNVLAVGNPK
jgi:nitroreductase